MSTPAQEEYNRLILKNAQESVRNHPSDNADAQSFLNLSEDEDNINTPRNRNLQSSRHENNNDDDDEDTFPPRPSYSTTRSTTTIPHTRYEANTGPKGVISDAQNFRDARRDKRISLSQQQQQRPLTEAGKLGQRLGELNFGEKEAAARGLESLGLGQEDQDEYLDEGDEGFMREWRMRRLREMQEASSGGAGLEGRFLGGGGGRRGGSGRRFGALSTVDGEGYLEAVDGSGEGTVVVVCIYDDMVSCAFPEYISRGAGGEEFLANVEFVFCSPTSPKPSSLASALWRPNTSMRALSSCTTRMRRWSRRAYRRSLRIRTAKSLRAWCRLWRRFRMMLISAR